jgi:predicted regulator of Ras-like GTPase activity (Roadblock/LC7/MglB family)
LALTTEHRALCQTELDRLVASTPGVRCAMLALRDGRPFVQSAAGIDPGRFAAMASSMCALGDSVLKELSSGSLDHVLVDGSDGKLVISKVPGCGGLIVLGLLATHQALLGLLLGHAKESGKTVSVLLQDAFAKP